MQALFPSNATHPSDSLKFNSIAFLRRPTLLEVCVTLLLERFVSRMLFRVDISLPLQTGDGKNTGADDALLVIRLDALGNVAAGAKAVNAAQAAVLQGGVVPSPPSQWRIKLLGMLRSTDNGSFSP
jgi:hypothetical protein